MTLRACSRAAARAMRRLTRSGNITLPSTVFHGNSWSNSWNTIMRSEPGRSIGLPLRWNAPDTGGKKPAIDFKSGFAAARRAEQHIAVAPMDLERNLPGRGDQMVLRLVLQCDLIGDQKRAVCCAVPRRIGHNFPFGRPPRSRRSFRRA